MITWSDIPLGWSIIAHYGPDGRVCKFNLIASNCEVVDIKRVFNLQDKLVKPRWAAQKDGA